jgi:putative transcriptional regulator
MIEAWQAGASLRTCSMKIDQLRSSGRPGPLDGQLLVAMPGMPDERFRRSVIYICAHSEDGAMGFVINRRANHIDLPQLLLQLKIIGSSETIELPARAERMPVMAGGPVETSRGFVLHSPDFFIQDSTLPISDTISLTITVDILRAIAAGKGPQSAILSLGYSGWAAGQLEIEMQNNCWLNCQPDADLLFETALDLKYDRALRKIGIDPVFLSTEAGHG